MPNVIYSNLMGLNWVIQPPQFQRVALFLDSIGKEMVSSFWTDSLECVWYSYLAASHSALVVP